MSGIRGKNTKPELLVRRALHTRGLRYRIHARELPGKPDLVFPRHRAVLFVHGCFWHGHDCVLFRLPSTRPEFLQNKIDTNRRNDVRASDALVAAGWRVGTVWECALRLRSRLPDEVAAELADWINSDRLHIEVRG